MSELIKNVEQAAKNILFNCAKGEAGDTLLIVHEACDEGYYDPKLHGLVAEATVQLQANHVNDMFVCVRNCPRTTMSFRQNWFR